MNAVLLLALGLPGAALPAPPVTAPPLVLPAAGAEPVVLELHTLRDPGSRNMESHTLLAPKGWEVDGSAWWPPEQFFSILPSQSVTVRAPDGRFVRVAPGFAAVDFQPSQYSRQFGAQRPQEWTADNGYPVVWVPESPRDWKKLLQEKVLPLDYPDAKKIRVTRATELPELTGLLEKQLAPIRQQQEQDNRQWAAMGGDLRSSCAASAIGLEWTLELGGKPIDGMTVLAHMRLDSDQQVGRQTSWTIESAVSFGAPKGELQAGLPLLMAIANSVRPTPGWARMKADHMRAMNRIAAKGAADRAGILADSAREISDIIHEGWKSRNASQDATHAKFVDMIRGVEHYSGGGASAPVQLPAGYAHVYRSANGEYLLTDDAGLDPNTDPALRGTDWKAMKVAR